LVCPPSEFYSSVFGLEKWEKDTVEAIRQVTDRPIVIRPKSSALQNPFNSALRDAFIVVTHNSNAAVEAVIAGVPVCVSPVSAAYPMSTPIAELERPRKPDRTAWAYSLAYSQFTIPEMKNGTAIRIIRNQL